MEKSPGSDSYINVTCKDIKLEIITPARTWYGSGIVPPGVVEQGDAIISLKITSTFSFRVPISVERGAIDIRFSYLYLTFFYFS